MLGNLEIYWKNKGKAVPFPVVNHPSEILKDASDDSAKERKERKPGIFL